MRLIGVDGCRAGWVAAGSDETLAWVTFAIVERLETLLDDAERDGAIVAIDMPIGLPEDEPRLCEQAARRRLGFPRNTSVFSTPCRSVLGSESYADVCARNRTVRGVGVSRQLYGILPKIREADAVVTPSRQAWVREAHPEVIFAELAGGARGLSFAKRTAAGEAERLAILRRYLPCFDPAAERGRLGLSKVARDDLLDAAACLVTASRVHRGDAMVLPGCCVQRDARGLRMEIVA